MGVCEILIQLDCSAEKFECGLVLLKKTVAITDDTPSFGGKERLLYRLVTEIDQSRLVL